MIYLLDVQLSLKQERSSDTTSAHYFSLVDRYYRTIRQFQQIPVVISTAHTFPLFYPSQRNLQHLYPNSSLIRRKKILPQKQMPYFRCEEPFQSKAPLFCGPVFKKLTTGILSICLPKPFSSHCGYRERSEGTPSEIEHSSC